MIWLCGGQRGLEYYSIDTDNVQKSLRCAYCEESFFLNEFYTITKDSKFSMIEHEHYFETFIDEEPAEIFVKIRVMNYKQEPQKIRKECDMKKCVILETENKVDFENKMNEYLSGSYKVEASSCNSKYYKAILVLED